MRTRTTAALLAVVTLTATGCSSLMTSTPEPHSRVPRPSTPASPSSPLALGDAWTWRDTELPATGTAIALGYEQPVKAGTSAEEATGEDGYVWAALEVKVCLKKGKTIHVSNMPWALGFADGAREDPSGKTYGDFPKPEFPVSDAPVKQGDCVRGKIVYALPEDQRPERAMYAAGADEGPGEWTIPKR
ncbi:hypothetical protein [Streptomyces daliensis]|uniref:DUF4352 domain-containing protein n=1 Tax=Streptomyces daliensis TaxID=299421 RepID=A0A8T4IL99_9ACTN|nr:hypothetical protein [Streptomyces daliensis]